ncbi:MAG TPA: CHASE2 domain-containing protein [Abditibacteriaceae bacterium]
MKSRRQRARVGREWQQVSPLRRVARLALPFLFIGAFCTFLDRGDTTFGVLERQTIALRMKLWAQRNSALMEKSRQRIVLVPISDSTFRDPAFEKLGGPPVPRTAHARVVRELKKAGASVIAFDILFDADRVEDTEFSAATRDFGRVAWAGLWDDGEKTLLLPNNRLRTASPHVGHTRSPHGNEAIVDRFEAVIDANNRVVPALSVEAVRLTLGFADQPLVRQSGGVRIGSWLLPTEANDTFRISFLGTPGDAFPTVPYEQIYHGIARDPMFRSSGFFRDKIVLIGDTTTLSRDAYATPVGRLSGMEIHAHAVATLLERSFLREAPIWSGPLAMLALMSLACMLAIRCRWLVAAASTTALLGSYFLAALWIFTDSGLLIPMAAPSVAALAMALATIIERGGIEERERARLKNVLEQYVSEQVSAGGAPTGKVALVFTDMENSSYLTQQHGLRFEQARDEHFELLRTIVRSCNGFEVETAGDSMFVVFARAADSVRFATATQSAMEAHPWPQGIGNLRLRIGIHFGEPFVGRDRNRLTYRGHDTNLAARVMSAAGGGQTFVSEALRLAVHNELPANHSFRSRGLFTMSGIGDILLHEICNKSE